MLSTTQLYTFIRINKRSILSFLAVGAASAIVNFASFGIFWSLVGLPYAYAVSIAYVLSVIFHFTANRHITFKSQGTNFLPQLSKYLVLIFINYFVTLFIVNYVVTVLHLSPYFGLVMAIGATVLTGYFMSRYWIFQAAV